MRKKFLRQRPLLTFPQFIIMLAIIFAIYVALDLNRRARAGQLVGVGEEALQQELMLETTRQVELQATLDYVQSDDYIAVYARDEGGQLQPAECDARSGGHDAEVTGGPPERRIERFAGGF